MEVFQKRLREARKGKSYTQQDLGDGIFVSKQEICLYEKGKRTPPMEVMMRMANFLEVDFLWLIGMELQIQREENRIVNLSAEDIKIIEALKKDKVLYQKFLEDPERTTAEISNKLKN